MSTPPLDNNINTHRNPPDPHALLTRKPINNAQKPLNGLPRCYSPVPAEFPVRGEERGGMREDDGEVVRGLPCCDADRVGVGSRVADVGDGGEGEDECCAGVGCCHVGDE